MVEPSPGFWEENEECKGTDEPMEEEDLNQTYTISGTTLNLVMTPRECHQFIKGLCLQCGKQDHYAKNCPLQKVQQQQHPPPPQN